MVSPTTDRRFAISGNLGMKAPVRMGTTANITLSGLQTIDTVVGVAADRVLVKDQTDPIENGIWVQATGTWTRDLDFNGTKDAITGTAVIIAEGSQAGGVWKVATTGTINPGTTSITFSVSFASDSADILNTPAGNIAAVTTQAAVNELDTEKAALAGATFTGLINQAKGANIASATTVDLTAATGNLVHITGTVTTTGFTMNAGQKMVLIADAAWPLTYNATTMKINGGASYTCAAGDRLYAEYDGTTTIVSIIKQDGTSLGTATLTGSFTASGVGFSGIAPTATWDYVISNGICHLLLRSLTGTSNTIALTVTGLPSIILPSENAGGIKVQARDNGVNLDTAFMRILTTGVTNVYVDAALTNWTAAGDKGLRDSGGLGQSISYFL